MLDQGMQPLRVDCTIYHPVTQPSAVIMPLSKPAIIENKSLCTQAGGLFSKLHELRWLMIKIHSLPAIVVHRSGFVISALTAHSRAIVAMKLLR